MILDSQNNNLLGKNVFVVIFWGFFLSIISVLGVLNMDLILPLKYGFWLLLPQGNHKTSTAVNLWIILLRLGKKLRKCSKSVSNQTQLHTDQRPVLD